MRPPGWPDIHLTYCLNVHPGATVAEMEEAVFAHAPAVFRRLRETRGVTGPFGVGLWLGDASARALDMPGALDAFKARLDAAGLYVFTLNGFPFGAFHGERVKEAVYRPDWSEPVRAEHTLRLARLLAELLPEGAEGSISTVPVTYRAWADPDRVAAATEALRATVLELAEMETRTGRTVRLALEPEPDCLLDVATEAVPFFEDRFFAKAKTEGEEAALRRHLGVCLDTVHCGVLGEDPAEALAAWTRAGVGVAKVQLGAALAADGSGAAREALAAYADPVYLHQTAVLRPGDTERYPDLPDALAHADDRSGGTWRVHFHLPLAWEGRAPLGSTRDDVNAAFLRAAREAGTKHLECEIYTLGVLPGATGRTTGILADELGYVLDLLERETKETP